MKQKAFTLIELLVVVAIIGILAAVGVVAYNGYTSSAKKAVVKQKHKQVVKYIAAEYFSKCVMGIDDGAAFGHSAGSGICPAIQNKKYGGAASLAVAYVTGVGDMDKNIYNPIEKAVRTSGKYVLGQTSLSGDFNIVTIKSCMADPCSGDNVILDTYALTDY